MLQLLSANDLEDSLERNIHCNQAMQAQIAYEMSKIQEEPIQQAKIEQQTANLGDFQAHDQQLAEIMEEEMIHHKQVSVLSHMHLQQAEEVKVQSQEIRCLLALVEKQQEVIKKLTKLASPQSPPRIPRATTSGSECRLDVMQGEIFNLILEMVNTR